MALLYFLDPLIEINLVHIRWRKMPKKGDKMIEYDTKNCSILSPTEKKQIPCLFIDGTVSIYL